MGLRSLLVLFSLLSSQTVFAESPNKGSFEDCADSLFQAISPVEIVQLHEISQVLNAAEFDLIPEILNLPDGALIPDAVFQKFDSRKIGRSLVARLMLKRDAMSEKDKPGYYDFWKDTKLHLVFPDSVFEKIQARGFLNSHQIHRGSYDPNYAGTMAPAEDEMIGLRFPSTKSVEAKVHEVRPKYSYVGFLKKDSRNWKTKIDTRYGNVVAVLKDHVKWRATFSAGNSWIERERAHTFAYQAQRPFPEPNYGKGVVGHHWEAQIWGDLTLDDVEYFMVDCPVFGALEASRVEAIKKANLPVVKCGNDKEKSSFFPVE